jgi:hypothetical protein
MTKPLMKLGIEGMYLNIINATYDKCIANIILNEKKTEPFPLKVRNKIRLATLSTFIHIVLEFLHKALRYEE